jgi:pantetheine-phosphate adenylyltransferase
MDKIAVFPGSFDPFTTGHESVVLRALPLFDKIIIAIGNNSSKSGFFTVGERMEMISEAFQEYTSVEVDSFEGLTVDYCRGIGSKYLLRGIRTAADFEYERAVAQMNKSMFPEVESVFLLTTPELTPVTSTIVRDIMAHGGDVSKFLPKTINIPRAVEQRKKRLASEV